MPYISLQFYLGLIFVIERNRRPSKAKQRISWLNKI